MARAERALAELPSIAGAGRPTGELATGHNLPGTLAAELRAFRGHYGLAPNFFPLDTAAAMNPFERVRWILARDHDAYHVLCEYETSDHDEVALQSFLCGQAPCVLAVFFARVVRSTELGRARFKHLRDILDCPLDREALERGRDAGLLVAVDLPEHGRRSVSQLRAALEIAPRRLQPAAAELRNTCGGLRVGPYFTGR
jgi:ubiquinone biosynthesis protein COQ4